VFLLTLLPEDPGQGTHSLREASDVPWRFLPNDLPPGRASLSSRDAGLSSRSFAWATRCRRLAKVYE
jgi:hypothetical protein